MLDEASGLETLETYQKVALYAKKLFKQKRQGKCGNLRQSKNNSKSARSK